jgi:hypothetical protein
VASTTSPGDRTGEPPGNPSAIGATSVTESPITAEGAAPASTTPQRRTFSDRLPRPWLFPLLILAIDWILIVASWQASNAFYHQSHGWTYYFWYKDAGYYGDIAKYWYSQRPGFHSIPSRAAFFPVYPILIWLASFLTGHNIAAAGLIATIVSGVAATLGVWLLTARISDRWVADRAVLLFAAFPGAMTLGMMYSEPLGIALAAFCLLAAINRRWLVAGLIAAVGTAEHPTLIALAGALGILALREIWTRRDWRSLIAPVLAPVGMVSFFAYVGLRYNNDFLFWQKLERRQWGHHVDWGVHELRLVTWSLPGLDKYAGYFAMVIALVVILIVGIALMLRARVPLVVSAFTVITFFSLVLTYGVGPTPRYAWAAIGIFPGFAAKLPRWLYWPMLILFAVVLFILVAWWPHHPKAPPP